MPLNEWTVAYGYAVALLIEHKGLEAVRVLPVT